MFSSQMIKKVKGNRKVINFTELEKKVNSKKKVWCMNVNKFDFFLKIII